MDQITISEGLKRGLRRHCPHCDSPTLFSGYLTVQPRCPVCGADNGQHRVDDIASYFTILLVGHLVIAPSLAIPWVWSAPLWASMSILMTLVLVITLTALPYIKGGVIGVLAATGDKKADDAKQRPASRTD
ncbi:DUF983 domain-containing protein [Sphingobium sp. AP50]|uniref:DUF983 domain-containing protein n=1 Tax=Sphingobium sp. AP50 TaxID=1884369 RepID=UPI0015A4EFD2|nr:DUF983 domain-containing protein [Sphingobium sp. AP50]